MVRQNWGELVDPSLISGRFLLTIRSGGLSMTGAGGVFVADDEDGLVLAAEAPEALRVPILPDAASIPYTVSSFVTPSRVLAVTVCVLGCCVLLLCRSGLREAAAGN